MIRTMKKENFIQNIIDQIKEAQIKLGYAEETVRLYFPADSLAAILGLGSASAPSARNSARTSASETHPVAVPASADANVKPDTADANVKPDTADEKRDPAATKTGSSAHAAALLRLLENEFQDPDPQLGSLGFARTGSRIEVSVPPEGVRFVHDKIPDPPFLKDLVHLFETHPSCTLDEIRQVFNKYDAGYSCLKMPDGTDFDYCLHFPKGSTDSYYYCVKEEMGHTIYHRFTEEDYKALMA